MQAECGAAFTNKLEGMFKDVDLSRDVLMAFRNSVRSFYQADMGRENKLVSEPHDLLVAPHTRMHAYPPLLVSTQQASRLATWLPQLHCQSNCAQQP